MRKINGPYHLVPFTQENAPSIIIEATLTETEESFFVSFRLKGINSSDDLAAIDLEAQASHKRVIELWKKTCFEFFIKNEHGNYFEYNLSSNFEWNCFYFEKKGDALTEYPLKAPKEDILHSLEVFHLIAEIPKESWPKGFITEVMDFNLTSVIKNKEDGALSYWALSHKDSRPNFHHFDSFISKS